MALNKHSKVKLFTHSDLDGIGCEIIGRLAFYDIDVTIVKNPQDASVKVSRFIESGEFTNYDKIFITDISVDKRTAMLIDDLTWESHRFALLDHHLTADYLNEYNWALVKGSGLRGKESGTNMFLEYLILNKLLIDNVYSDALGVFVEKIRRYDTWEWKDIYADAEAGALNQLFFLLGRETFVNKYLYKFQRLSRFTFQEGFWVDMFDKADRAVLDIDNAKKDAYIDRKENQMVCKNLLGHKVGFVFAEQYISELGNVLSERNRDLKFIVIIDMGGKKVSYRTVHKDIDLGKEVAGKFGGGGHALASGSQFSKHVTDLTFNMIFGLGIIGKVRKLFDKAYK